MNEKEIAVPNLLEESGVEKMILIIRGKQVLLDRDLAALYGVETRAINQAVKRNMERFPERNCFQLTELEFSNWKSQIVMSNSIRMGMRRPPVVFTELGIAMLSSVLRSETAIQVNINIMRAFVAIRHAIGAWQGVNLKVEQLSHKVDNLNARVDEILHEQNENNMEMAVQISALNDALDQLREKPAKPRKKIGFKQSKE